MKNVIHRLVQSGKKVNKQSNFKGKLENQIGLNFNEHGFDILINFSKTQEAPELFPSHSSHTVDRHSVLPL